MTSDVAYLRWLCLETFVVSGMGLGFIALVIWLIRRSEWK